jgi:protein O-mannosyl-transferase
MIRTAYAPARHAFAVATVLVVLLAVVVHLGVLGLGFTLDDVGIVQENPLVHSWSGLWRAFVSPWWPNGAGQYRPLVLASFTVDWWLGGGSPGIFHAGNVAWHALVVALVMRLARELCSFGGCVVAGILFAVHPVHVEAIAGVVGRAELMAAAGLLAALVLHRRRSPWAAVAFAVGLASKEHVLVFPVLALLFDQLAPTAAPATRAPSTAHARWVPYASYGVVAVLWACAVAWVFRASIPAPPHPMWIGLDAPSRWLTMLGVVPLWARLLVFPFDLSADYAPAVVRSWPAAWPMTLVGLAILSTAGLVAWRSRLIARPVLLAMLWVAVALLPVANLVIPTGIVTAERVLYLPSVGAVLLLAMGVEHAARTRAAAAVAAVVLVALAWSAKSVMRVPVWESNKSVLLATLNDHPESSLAHGWLGRVYAANRATDQAIEEFLIAAQLFPVAAAPWLDATRTAMAAGRPGLADSLLARGLATGAEPYALWMRRGDLARERLDGRGLLQAGRSAARLREGAAEPQLMEVQGWLLLGQRDSADRAAARVGEGTARRTAQGWIRGAFGSR